MNSRRRALLVLLITVCVQWSLHAQVPSDRLLHSASEPQNWLTYSGSYSSTRYSSLQQIDLQNARNLELKWVFQAQSLEKFEATPLVVDGIMYLSQAPNDVVALDAKTGRVFWIYHYSPGPIVSTCCGVVNRGVAILDDTLFMATVDAHLVAIDARNGHLLWDAKVAEASKGYAMTLAPLVIKDKVLVGVAGGEYGIRGFISAYEAKSGKEAWRFYTIPGPGEPGHETWSGDSWMHGGASVWLTGSYDPELNLTYWGVGNPGPDLNHDIRKGDDLYSSSVVALDPETGKVKWHFQFSPNDPYDFDAVQIPVLIDTNWSGSPRKLMLWANRNGFYYVLDRGTGKFVTGKPFVKVNWASGLDPETGRPILTPQPPGAVTYPGVQGGTNWYSPSYSPRTGFFYISTWEDYGAIFQSAPVEYKEGQRYMGGIITQPIPGNQGPGTTRRGPINTYTEAAAHGAVIALDPHTGEKKWSFNMVDVGVSGILTTASDLLFVGGREGYFQALNANSGALLWKANLGGEIVAGPMTYMVNGKQYVGVASGNALFVFGLRE
ncbi:MAG: PQQ-dependent dehydrogenase, methanol/ethanol family [Candidatus Acidiferrales bacterium]|jgi:alcohol dehydrogenase (cytochrome c)